MWIREAPANTEANQQTALNTTFIITKTLGPSSIELLKPGENSSSKSNKIIKYRVKIGEQHQCTCKLSRNSSNELCVHICWTLLKYLKLTVLDARSWQIGLPFRDIESLISEKDCKPDPKINQGSQNGRTSQNDETPQTEGRDITIDDVCPICQETLLSAQKPVCHCNSCLQNVHIHCMKIWCDHQPSVSEEFINCPMCRCSFSTNADFRKLVHQEALYSRTFSNKSNNNQISKRFKHEKTCENCDISPITGRLYNCVNCSDLYLCAACFTNGCHSEDGDEFRFKTSKSSQFKTARKRFKRKEMPVIDENNLMDREVLLQLDEPDLQRAFDIPADPSSIGLPQHVVNLIPSTRLRKKEHKLIKGKCQCLLCLKKYQLDDYVRKLACGHYFHRTCVDGFLLEDYQTCPVCGNDAVRHNTSSSNYSSPKLQSKGSKSKGAGDSLDLELFGVNTSEKRTVLTSNRLPPLRRPKRLGKTTNSSIPSKNSVNNLLADSFVGLNITGIAKEDGR